MIWRSRGGARLEKKAQTRLEERRLPLSFIEEDTRQQLRKEESNRHSLSCLAPPALVRTPSLRRAISSTALKQRQPGESHDKELIELKEDAATSWIFAVRGEVVRRLRMTSMVGQDGKTPYLHHLGKMVKDEGLEFGESIF